MLLLTASTFLLSILLRVSLILPMLVLLQQLLYLLLLLVELLLYEHSLHGLSRLNHRQCNLLRLAAEGWGFGGLGGVLE